MEHNTDVQKRKANRFFNAAWVAALLFALTWGLPSFFNWVFFSAAFYLFFLSWYTLPRAQQARTYARPAATAAEESPLARSKGLARKIVAIMAVFVFGVFFLLFMIGLFVSEDAPEDTAEQTDTESVSISADRVALEENPNDVDALINVGNVFLEAWQFDSALVYYDRVLKLDRKNVVALYKVGIAYYNQQQYQKAIDVLKQSVQLQPNNGDAFFVLGHCYYDQKLQDEAFTWYTKAYENGFQDSFLSHVLGYLHDNKGNTSRAISFYKEAVKLDSSRADIYTRLAELEPVNASRYGKLAEKWKSN